MLVIALDEVLKEKRRVNLGPSHGMTPPLNLYLGQTIISQLAILSTEQPQLISLDLSLSLHFPLLHYYGRRRKSKYSYLIFLN